MDNPHNAPISKAMDFDADIAVVGGGLNGPALALALAQIGLRVTVIDSLPATTRAAENFDGRSYALALTSVRLLQSIGVWDAVQENAQPMLEIKVTDGRAGEGASPFFMHFDHAEIEEGPKAESNITLMDGETVTAQQTDSMGARLALASGKVLRVKLIVGADGRSSGTAQRAGIKRIGWDYGQTALVCAIAHDRPHQGIAHQFFMPPGPLAILPLTENRSSIVWSETTANAARINALSEELYLDVLRPRFGDFLGEISLAGARYTYPLSLSLTHSMVADRVALLGDAAHGVHPIAGQGLNAGMRDVAALAEVVADAYRRGQDVGSATVLNQYQLWRRFDNTALALATDTFNRLFSNDNPALRLARDIGMAALNAIPSVRRGFIREAAGLTGTLPRLMRGEVL